MGREHGGGGGSHPLSLEAEGSLPAARASAPSADREHTTHYQQRPPLSLGGDAAGCVCVCVRVDDRFHCRTSWLFCRGSASCDRPTAQNPRVLGNFSRKIILPRIRVRSPSEQAATRTVRNHLRQCESSRELVILKLVRCNAINETGKGKKRFSPLSSASCSRSSVSPGGWSVCLAARGEEKILVFFSGFIYF